MKKIIILLLLVLISICAISQVSAADDFDDVALDNSSDIEIQVMEETILPILFPKISDLTEKRLRSLQETIMIIGRSRWIPNPQQTIR